jgi:hypothetical protein
MQIAADPDLLAVAEFMQSRLTADRLVPVAHALAGIAPALWGHLPSTEVRALSLQGVKPIR